MNITPTMESVPTSRRTSVSRRTASDSSNSLSPPSTHTLAGSEPKSPPSPAAQPPFRAASRRSASVMSSTPSPAPLLFMGSQVVLSGSRSSEAPTSSRKRVQATKKATRAPNFRKPQSFVTINVGNPPQAFMIHKDVLCFHSKLFAEVFTSDCDEAKTGVMIMDDVEPEVFGTLVHYLYTQKVHLDDEEEIKAEEDDDSKISVTEKLIMLTELWTLAHVCMMKGLQNESMEMLFPLLSMVNGDELRDLAIQVYASNEGTTQLKKAVLEKIAFGLNEEELAEWMGGQRRDQLPAGMLVDIIMILKRCTVVDVALDVVDYFVR